MKKSVLLFVFILIGFTGISQNFNGQKIKLLKTSFITDALNLTSSEAEKFWPVYNFHTKKIQKLKYMLEGGMQRDIRLAGGLDNLSDEEAQKFIEDAITLNNQIAQSKIDLIKELSKIISPKKIIRLQKAERDFNRRILQEYSKRQRMQRNKN